MNVKKKILQILFLALLIAGCSADASKNPFAIKGYNCEALIKVELEESLKEISGLAYDKHRNAFLTINDEQGIIFILEPETFRIKNKIHFGSKGDYEEIQLSDDGNTIYVLRSDGTIFKMQYEGAAISEVTAFEYQGPKTEFESFYVKPANHALVLIPKNSKAVNADKKITGYIISCSTGESKTRNDFNIDWNKLSIAASVHPSAVAVRSDTKEIYVLASIERVLLVLNASYTIAAEYKLPASLFQQPEGITFDAEHNLYISNEAKDAKPTIIKIPIQSK